MARGRGTSMSSNGWRRYQVWERATEVGAGDRRIGFLVQSRLQVMMCRECGSECRFGRRPRCKRGSKYRRGCGAGQQGHEGGCGPPRGLTRMRDDWLQGKFTQSPTNKGWNSAVRVESFQAPRTVARDRLM